MEFDNTLITKFGISIITPIIAYLKIRDERSKTGEKRDTQIALIEQKLTNAENKLLSIDQMKESINRINVTLSKIETILEIYIKNQCKDYVVNLTSAYSIGNSYIYPPLINYRSNGSSSNWPSGLVCNKTMYNLTPKVI